MSKTKHIEYTIMSDRIVTGTYGGFRYNRWRSNNKVYSGHLTAIISVLSEAGCNIRIDENQIYISGPKRPQAVDVIRTLPYPGFPTDMQAPLVSLLSIAKGTSIIIETVFENRYKHVDELMRMGANITQEGRIAVIRGVDRLIGASVHARDLRGAAALVLAGLAAEGETIVNEVWHLDRGYENIEEVLSSLGALVRREALSKT